VHKDTTAADFRTTFSSDAGRRTLANMLIEGKFFSHAKTYEDLAVQNFLKDVLWKAECYPLFNKKGDNSAVDQYVRGLFNIKVK
jgi:hypothetical protein